jgi:hypothetical protein
MHSVIYIEFVDLNAGDNIRGPEILVVAIRSGADNRPAVLACGRVVRVRGAAMAVLCFLLLVVGGLLVMTRGCLLVAQSGQSDRTRVCPLLDQSGQIRASALTS